MKNKQPEPTPPEIPETPNSSKLEEARELLKNWESHIDCGGCMVICGAEEISWHVPVYQVDNLITAQDLLSYERGREDQRKEDAEIIKSLIPTYNDTQNINNQIRENAQSFILKVALEKILNPEAQQALKSDNQ